MPDSRPENEPVRRKAVRLMRTGAIGPSDIAPLVKLSPQAVYKWAIAAKIDVMKARARWARRCWQDNEV